MPWVASYRARRGEVPDGGWKRRHAAIVRELDFPGPFGLEEFAARLGRQRGRPVLLCPFTAKAGVPCGLWIGTAEADYVYYERGTTPYHATSIALHEIAHLLLGHRGIAAWQDLAQWLAPDVDPSLVRIILGRSAYSTPEERDAETLASFMLERATARPGAGSGLGPSGGWVPAGVITRAKAG
jgi:hypothetical protein